MMHFCLNYLKIIYKYRVPVTFLYISIRVPVTFLYISIECQLPFYI